eukprot:943317-Rhodomonas_salina.1
MPGTEKPHGVSCLRARYALSGTALAHGAGTEKRMPPGAGRGPMCGTEIAYGAAMCGTEIAYGAGSWPWTWGSSTAGARYAPTPSAEYAPTCVSATRGTATEYATTCAYAKFCTEVAYAATCVYATCGTVTRKDGAGGGGCGALCTQGSQRLQTRHLDPPSR